VGLDTDMEYGENKEEMKNLVHVFCDCEKCERTDNIINALQKRIGEVTPKGYIPLEKLVWTDEAFSIVKWELQKIWDDKKWMRENS